jgi:hypothetical protein
MENRTDKEGESPLTPALFPGEREDRQAHWVDISISGIFP